MNRPEQKQFYSEIIKKHKGILLKVARVYCQNETDRQDLMQEIMIQVWHSIDRYDKKFRMSTWLYRISLNVAISFYRKNISRTKKYIVLDNKMIQTPVEAEMDNEQHLKLLEQFISELKEIDKALMLLYLEDKSHAEIGEILGMSISNVGTKVGRIKKQLKTRFTQVNA